MKQTIPILSITGSDSTGGSGIQADIRTISALGGCAVTAVTSVTVQSSNGILAIHELPSDLVIGQVKATISDANPKAIKIGMIHNADTIRGVGEEIIACNRVVCDPGVLSSHGKRLMDAESIDALCRFIIPQTTLLLLKCSEAEILLGRQINTDDDMLEAAQQLNSMGAQWVMLRGGQYTEGRLTALLFTSNGPKDKQSYQRFFSSVNVEGWQKHGVGGALSSAIATCMAFGDDIPTSVSKAHDYMHSQVVYAVNRNERNLRPADIYNEFMSLIAANYKTAHGVAFYADKLCISTRYLSKITDKVICKSPKQVIADYLIQEAKIMLDTSRLTVQEVSYRLGFCSQSMFCNFFRSQIGCSPTEYRNLKSEE